MVISDEEEQAEPGQGLLLLFGCVVVLSVADLVLLKSGLSKVKLTQCLIYLYT